jgi:hypothetical protein
MCYTINVIFAHYWSAGGLEMESTNVAQEMENLCRPVMVLTVENRMLRSKILGMKK